MIPYSLHNHVARFDLLFQASPDLFQIRSYRRFITVKTSDARGTTIPQDRVENFGENT
jgi:hypothetical protein